MPWVFASMMRGIASSIVSPAISNSFFISYKHLCCGCSIRPGIEHHFGAVVLLIAENFVHLGRLIDRWPVAHYKAGIDVALLDTFKQRFHVAHHVCLAGFH